VILSWRVDINAFRHNCSTGIDWWRACYLGASVTGTQTKRSLLQGYSAEDDVRSYSGDPQTDADPPHLRASIPILNASLNVTRGRERLGRYADEKGALLRFTRSTRATRGGAWDSSESQAAFAGRHRPA